MRISGTSECDFIRLRTHEIKILLNAVTGPSPHDLGSAPVPVDKTNEIPVARLLFERLDLVGWSAWTRYIPRPLPPVRSSRKAGPTTG